MIFLMKFFAFFTFFVSSLFSQGSDHYVVCVHGFMGGGWCMHFLEKNLKKDGWEVVNWSYSSREDYIENHAKKLLEKVEQLAKQKPGKPIHFVAHSMGGLVVLAAMNANTCPKEAKQGRVVLIGSPIRGSRCARALKNYSWIRSFAKDFAGKQLMEKETFEHLGKFPPSLDKILVITGTFGWSFFLDGPCDGTVLVEETQLDVPHEQVQVARGHVSLIFSKKVVNLTRDFLLKKPIQEAS